jgi:hypothetical protein
MSSIILHCALVGAGLTGRGHAVSCSRPEWEMEMSKQIVVEWKWSKQRDLILNCEV